jgi:hypothetical protein
MATMKEFLEENKGIELLTEHQGTVHEDDGTEMDKWKCVLKFAGRSMEFTYRMGLGHRKNTRPDRFYLNGGFSKAEIERGWYKDRVLREMYLRYWKPVAPILEDVLDSLASDSSTYDTSRNFKDWASEFGYSDDSIKADKIYRLCGDQAKELRFVLGAAPYEKLLYEVERL